MKISCTVKELAQMVRDCDNGECSSCVLNNICTGGTIEDFVRADDITDDVKEEPHDGK